MTARATATDRARLAVASLLSAVILGYDVLLWGTRDVPPAGYSPFQVSLVIAEISLAYLSAACVVLAITFLVSSLGERSRERARADQTVDSPPTPWGLRLRAAFITPPVRSSFRALASAAVALGMSLLVLIGLLDVYLWKPLSLVPNLSIDNIYAAMTAANQVASHNLSTAWAAYCMLLTSVFVVIALVPPIARVTPARLLLILGFSPFAFGLMGFPWAGFHMVWQLGDTFFSLEYSGPTPGSVIPIIAQLSLAAVAFLSVAPWRRVGASAREDRAQARSLPNTTH